MPSGRRDAPQLQLQKRTSPGEATAEAEQFQAKAAAAALAQLQQHLCATLDEYVSIGDVNEAMECVQDLGDTRAVSAPSA